MGDIVRMSMSTSASGRGCGFRGGGEKDGTEEEGIFVVGGHTGVRTRTSKEL